MALQSKKIQNKVQEFLGEEVPWKTLAASLQIKAGPQSKWAGGGARFSFKIQKTEQFRRGNEPSVKQTIGKPKPRKREEERFLTEISSTDYEWNAPFKIQAPPKKAKFCSNYNKPKEGPDDQCGDPCSTWLGTSRHGHYCAGPCVRPTDHMGWVHKCGFCQDSGWGPHLQASTSEEQRCGCQCSDDFCSKECDKPKFHEGEHKCKDCEDESTECSHQCSRNVSGPQGGRIWCTSTCAKLKDHKSAHECAECLEIPIRD